MLCPKCGSPMEPGSDACSVCGAVSGNPVAGEAVRPPMPERIFDDDDYDSADATGGPSRKAIAVFVILFVIATAAIAVWALGDDEPDAEDSRTVGNVTLYGGMTSAFISVTDPVNGTVSYSGDGSSVRWEVKVLSATFLVKTEYGYYEERGYSDVQGKALTFSEPGNYQIRLYVDGSQKATGRVVLDGTVSQSFTWSQAVDGRTYTYSADCSYSFMDYYRYASDASAIREESMFLEANRFVAVDSPIINLESALSKEYLEVRGSSMSLTGHEYADYLLSFVQCAIPYPDMVSWKDGHWYYDPEHGNGDMYINGQNEYWSYPMETLYLGTGDCEDTSFLACALFSAAGYTSGVAVLEDHVMAAVKLDSVAPNPDPDFYASETFILYTGGTMYFCETTYSVAVSAGYFSQDNRAEIAALTKLSMVDPYKAAAA